MTAMLLWRNLKNERNFNNYGIPSSPVSYTHLDVYKRQVLAHTLRAVDAAQSVDEIVIAAREEDLLTYAELCKTYGIRKPVKVVVGGATRQESVLRAALEARADAKLLAVQDGARPLVTPELLSLIHI